MQLMGSEDSVPGWQVAQQEHHGRDVEQISATLVPHGQEAEQGTVWAERGEESDIDLRPHSWASPSR